MNQTPGWWLTVLAAIAGMAVGAFGCLWRARRIARQRKRIPKHWPLDSRLMANTEECKVWRWLSRVFFDHHVMIKVPVTRFTLPRTKESGLHWYNLLSGVYCTFTVCAADGRVVGCVDVPGRNGISRSNRQLKLMLLSQCGIAYWVVKSNSLPTLAEIRTEFLGELAPMTGEHEYDTARMTAAHQKLRAAIDHQRHSRHSDLSPLTSGNGPTSVSGPESHLPADSDFSGGWQQQNSFVAPLDSRRGGLR